VIPRPAPPRTILADDSVASEARVRTVSAVTSAAEFEWPVEGAVLSSFGKSDDGTRNDGINIAAELGTPIHAAAGGTVTYVGNEVRGYGNLILIRHDDGFITAYAHAQSIIVSRGDRVDRGDVIGYSGDTGDVATPQLHFEIRQGVKPVDPRPLLVASRES
jgi:murein DD-endopeptidase MepM/ murein hydrolase activator NlpD